VLIVAKAEMIIKTDQVGLPSKVFLISLISSAIDSQDSFNSLCEDLRTATSLQRLFSFSGLSIDYFILEKPNGFPCFKLDIALVASESIKPITTTA